MAVTFNTRFFESYAVLGSGVVQAGVLLKVRQAGGASRGAACRRQLGGAAACV
jgi:hypothetical protein